MPSKVVVFSWKLLHNGLLAKENILRRRNVSRSNDVGCIVCDGQVKPNYHLLVSSEVAFVTWYQVFFCLGWHRPLLYSIVCVFDFFFRGLRRGRPHLKVWSRSDILWYVLFRNCRVKLLLDKKL